MDQTTADVQAEAKEPQDKEDDDDCPKHFESFSYKCLAMASAEGCAV